MSLRIRLALLLGVIVLATLAPLPGAGAQGIAEQTCPATFEILHDDRIGRLELPSGHYAITLLDSDALSCARASDLFRQFLEDWNGRLPRPWVLNAATATFTRGSNGSVGFRVAAVASPSGGGGGGRHPATGVRCPGTFRVLHDDRIGSFGISAGNYRITLLSVSRLSCSRAAALLARFLHDFDGRLPRPWLLDPETGSFIRGSRHVGFRLKRATGPPTRSGAGGGGLHPTGSRCPGTFRVLSNDMIGRLRLPAGPYRITLLEGAGLSCRGAARLFRGFLLDVDGVLQRPWVLDQRTATFTRGRGDTGFRVKPARS